MFYIFLPSNLASTPVLTVYILTLRRESVGRSHAVAYLRSMINPLSALQQDICRYFPSHLLSFVNAHSLSASSDLKPSPVFSKSDLLARWLIFCHLSRKFQASGIFFSFYLPKYLQTYAHLYLSNLFPFRFRRWKLLQSQIIYPHN